MTKKSRKNERAAVSLSARYRSPTAFEFVTEEASDLSNGGMFIRSLQPAPAGTLLKLEVDVDGGTETIRGVARVVWLRLEDMGGEPAGMGVKFVKLEPGGRQIIASVLERLGVHEELPAGRTTWTPSEPPPMPRFSAVPSRSSFAPTRKSVEPTRPRVSAETQPFSPAAAARPSTLPLGSLQRASSGDALASASRDAPAQPVARSSASDEAPITGRTLMMSAVVSKRTTSRDSTSQSLPAGILSRSSTTNPEPAPEPTPPDAEPGSVAQAVWDATEPFENAESLVSEVTEGSETDLDRAFDQAPTGELPTSDPWQDAVATQAAQSDAPPAKPESVRPGRPDARDLRERLRHHRKPTSEAPAALAAHDEHDEHDEHGAHEDAAKAEDAWRAITRESLADAEAARDAMERGSAPLEADALATSADAERRAEKIGALPREVPKTRAGSSGKTVTIAASVALMIAAGVIGYRSTHAPVGPPETRPAPPAPAKLPPRPPAPVAAAPTPPPPAPAPAPEPPPPTEYVIEVVTTPAGALVSAGKTTVTSPGTLRLGKLEAAVEVAAEKPGFMRTVALIDRVGFEAENGEMRRTLALTLAALPPPKPAPVVAPPPPPPPPKPAPVAASTKPTPIAVAPATPKPTPVAVKLAPPKPAPEPAPVAVKPAPPKPAPEPAPVKAEPVAKEPALKPFDAARECLAKGDNDCVIKALDGKAKTAREFELLVETYRAMGNADKAKAGMQAYVKRFPDEKRALTYQRMLDGQ